MSITFLPSTTPDAVAGSAHTRSRRNSCVALEWTRFALIHERRNKLVMPTQPGALTGKTRRSSCYASSWSAASFTRSRRNAMFATVFSFPTASVGLIFEHADTLTAECGISIPGSLSRHSRRNHMLATTYSRMAFDETRRNIMYAFERPAIESPIMLYQYPGYMQITTDTTPSVVDIGMATDSASAFLTKQAFDAPIAEDAAVGQYSGTVFSSDTAQASDAAAMVYFLLAMTEATASDSASLSYLHYLLALDVAEAFDSATAQLMATLIAQDFAAAQAAVAAISYVLSNDSAAATTAAHQQLTTIAVSADTAEATTSLVGYVVLMLITSDSATAEDAATAQLTATLHTFDTAQAFGTLQLAGVDYSVYAMTVENTAVTEYTNFQFNSFMGIGGSVYGASDAGITKLEGPDDEGTQIDAEVDLGLNTLGVALEKACPAVYVGYTSSGAMALKVVTTDGGVKKENWYQLSPIAQASPDDNRFTPNKGLHSIYWGWKIANIGGADFTLDFVKVWRMQLSRRIRR